MPFDFKNKCRKNKHVKHQDNIWEAVCGVDSGWQFVGVGMLKMQAFSWFGETWAALQSKS